MSRIKLLLLVLLAGCASLSPAPDPYDAVAAAIASGEISFAGGDGSSYDEAIVVRGAQGSGEGIAAEYLYLVQELGPLGTTWQRLKQTLINHDGQLYDVIRVRLADGERDYFFDASGYYGSDQ